MILFGSGLTLGANSRVVARDSKVGESARLLPFVSSEEVAVFPGGFVLGNVPDKGFESLEL